ncbi:hypothetical protein SAMN05216214_101189 [Atopomonas hussainii]|uniref:NADH:ubiquinone oxidoreductase n=1 Tax=Atopomonas hussainii TaxID=1429083 RepID=A0A1H7FD12_9GAMM|nr:hypothetical protein [Atopomonas hussainii]SEK23981.1 hypothetical protein SAMN05216214_101189 [Atopomonas hussainii]
MRAGLVLAMLPSWVWAQACVVETPIDDHQSVRLCQENVSIPKQLFSSGFCQPQLKGKVVTVSFVEQCPAESYGVCRNAQVQGTPYRQHIHYYGHASDGVYLSVACEKQYHGQWHDLGRR